MVQDEGEQFRLQRVLWGVDQRLQVFSASGHHLVAEDEQEITEDSECLQNERDEKGGETVNISKNYK